MITNFSEYTLSPFINELLEKKDEEIETILSKPETLSQAINELAQTLKLTTQQTDAELLHTICTSLTHAKSTSYTYGQTDKAQKLLKCAQKILVASDKQHLPQKFLLHDAAKIENKDLLLEYLDKETDVAKKIELLNQEDETGQTVLHYALAQDSHEKFLKEIIAQLIERGVPLDAVLADNKKGYSLIRMLCCYANTSNDISLLKKAYDAGLSFDCVDLDGTFPLMFQALEYRASELFRHCCKDMGLSPEVNMKSTANEILLNAWRGGGLYFSEDSRLDAFLSHLENNPSIITNNPNKAAQWLSDCLESPCCSPAHKNRIYACVGHLTEKGKRSLICRKLVKQDKSFIEWAASEASGIKDLFNQPLGDVATAKTPEELEFKRNLTPLALVLSENNPSFTLFLLNQGIPLFGPTQKGENILQWLINNPEILSQNVELLPKILEKTDIQSKNQEGKNLLHVLAGSTHFNAMYLLISEGIHLDSLDNAAWNKLLENAFDNDQLDLIDLIINKGIKEQHLPALDNFSDKVYDHLLKVMHKRWSQSVFTLLHQRGIPLERALSIALETKHYHMAAFLISLGVTSPITLSKEIQESIDRYATYFARGKDDVRSKLVSQFTNKNLAHLFGDAYIAKMREGGAKVHGNTYSTTLNFASNLLAYFLENKETELTLEQTNAILALKNKYDNGLNFAHLVAISSGEEGLKRCGKVFGQKLDGLSVGESFIIPFGWRGVNKPGHAILLECYKKSDNEFTFIVYNTGEGLQYHDVCEHKDKIYGNMARAYKISVEDLNDGRLAELLLEAQVLGKERKSESYRDVDVYNVLAPFQVSEDLEQELIALVNPRGEGDLWMQAQIGGTCAFRSILATARFYLGKDLYKTFLEAIKSDVMDLVIEANAHVISDNSILRKIISKTIPQFATHAIKRLKAEESPEKIEETLSTIESQKSSAYAYFPSMTTALSAPSPIDQYKTQTEAIQERLSAAAPSSDIVTHTKDFPSIVFPETANVRDAESFATHLKECDQFLGTYVDFKRNCASHGTEMLRGMGRLLLDEKNPQGQAVWKSLEGLSKESLEEQFLNPLRQISGKLYKDLEQVGYPDPAHKAALYMSLFISYKIVQLMESKDTGPGPKVSNFRLSSNDLHEAFKDPYLLIFDDTLHKDIQLLLNFPFVQDLGGLFDFKHMIAPNKTVAERMEETQFKNKPYLELKEDDYMYALGIYATLSAEEKAECQKLLEYKKEYINRREGKIDTVHVGVWNATWAYTQKMPQYFQDLRQMALWARTESFAIPQASHSFFNSVRQDENPILRDDRPPNALGMHDGTVGFSLGGFTVPNRGMYHTSYDIRALDPTYGISDPERHAMRFFNKELGDFSSGKLSLRAPNEVKNWNVSSFDDYYSSFDDYYYDYPQSSPTVFTKDLFLESVPQNHLTATVEYPLQEPLAARIGVNDVGATAIPMCIEMLRNKPELMKHPQYRAYLYAQLFSDPKFLPSHLKEYPFLREELPEFFKEMIAYLDKELKVHIAAEAQTQRGQASEAVKISHGLLVTFDLYQRTLQEIEKIEPESVAGRMEELRTTIKDMHGVFYLNDFHEKIALKLKENSYLLNPLKLAYITSNKDKILDLHKETFQKIFETTGIDLSAELDQLTHEFMGLFSGNQSIGYLSLIIADSYHTNSSLTPSQVKEFLSCIVMDASRLTQLSDYRSPIMPPNVRPTALQAFVQHKKSIEQALKDPKEGPVIARHLFTLANVFVDSSFTYVPDAFPLIIFKKGKDSFEIDVSNGLITRNHITPSDLSNYYHSPLYLEIFGQKTIKGVNTSTSNEESYLCQDEHGEIKILGEPAADKKNSKVTEVTRKLTPFDGTSAWYSYSHDAPLDISPYSTWKKCDSHPAEYLYLDRNTFEVKVQLKANGEFIFKEEPTKRFELADLQKTEEGKKIAAFHRDARLWQEVGGSSKRLEFPGYKDENGKDMEFVAVEKKGKTRWVSKSDPKLFIAEKQTVEGLRHFPHALVLENEQGKCSLVIPRASWFHLTQEGRNPSEEGKLEITCLSFPLEKGIPQTRNSTQHALFLGYLALAQAEKAEDYLKALELLKSAARFDSYTAEDLRLLGWIFNITRESNDFSVQTNAVALFSHWLVEDNRRRNPASPVWKVKKEHKNVPHENLPQYHGDANDWVKFWMDSWKWKKKGKDISIGDETKKILLSYKRKIGHLESSLLLQNQIDPLELQQWSCYNALRDVTYKSFSPAQAFPTLPSSIVPQLEWDQIQLLPKGSTSTGRRNPPLNLDAWRIRADERLEIRFDELYEIALVGDAQSKKELKKYLHFMATDPTPKNYAYRLILESTLKEYHQQTSAERKLFDLVHFSIRNPKIFEMYTRKYEEVQKMQTDLNKCLMDVAKERINAAERTHSQSMSYDPSLERETFPSKSVALPSEVPNSERLSFTPPAPDTTAQKSYNNYFVPLEAPQTDAQIERFEYTPSKKNYPDEKQRHSIEESITHLNNDYQKGANKNLLRPQHELKNTEDLSAQIKTLSKEHRRAFAKKQDELQKIKKDMLALANRPPIDKKKRLIHNANLIAEHKKTLNENECEALFLQGDASIYAKSTHLTSEQDIARLHQLIGEYIVLSRESDHLNAIISGLKEVNDTEEQIQKLPANADPKVLTRLQEKREDALQSVGDLLAVKQHVDPAHDHPAFLVFEHRMGVYLRKDQIEKLKKVMPVDGKFPDVILQLIQGGGKTFVFGHILALLKADGYHLSIHVAPTAQYKTAIQDMKFNSNRAFGQKERTFEFDDNPEYFTKQYLTDLEYMLKSAIVNKEYVTVTKETLRAMRCKYLRTRRQIENQLEQISPQKNRGNAPSADYSMAKEPAAIQAMEASNEILERILALIDERGLLTFDEIHIAGNPYEELNMPTGVKEKIDFDHARLVSTIVIEAAAAKRADGTPLLLLNKNQQSQQKEDEFLEMKEKIIDKLFIGEVWKQNFGMSLPSTEDQKAIRAFIAGEVDNLPSFLNDIHLEAKIKNPKAASPVDLIILARQMLSGDWLKNSLQLSVSEHQGFPSEESLKNDSTLGRVSIPYIANMIPADGSEFSDPFVVITNTLIAYAVQGLNEEQIKDWIDILLNNAYQEYENKKEEGEQIAFEETHAFRQFRAITGRDLSRIDLTKQETIDSLIVSLKADTTEARKALFNYAIQRELTKVNFYSEQIASHGQNTFGIGSSTNGYTGSIDNPNIKPVGADLLLEEGTNGQTIDLLIRKNDDVWVVDNQPSDLFTLFRDHPRKEQIRAIIDIGCQFRGIPNKNVAEMICLELDKNTPVKGVLYFDKNDLYFMENKGPDYAIKKISGTKRETIEAETGCTANELFTYYDQDHITGVDINQATDALAIASISEHTKIHEILQGCRRLRRLDFGQRVAFAVQKGATTAISNKLEKPEISKLQPEKAKAGTFNVKDILLFGHLNEMDPQPDENQVLSIQKMENLVQKAVLRKMAKMPIISKRIAFHHTSYLFVKNISVDLYRDYAMKKAPLSPDLYYPLFGKLLVEPLQGIVLDNGSPLFTTEEYEELKTQLNDVVEEAKKTAKKDIQVPPNYEKGATATILKAENRNKIQNHTAAEEMQEDLNISDLRASQKAQSTQKQVVDQEEESLSAKGLKVENRNSTQTQIADQKQDEEGIQKQRQEQKQKELDKVKQANRKMPDASYKPFKEHQWQLEDFLQEIKQPKQVNPFIKPKDNPEIWSLNETLSHELKLTDFSLLDPRIHVTSNFVMSYENRPGIIDPPKPAFQVMLVGDPQSKDFRMVLCTVEEAQHFDKMLRQATKSNDAPPVQLCELNGKLIAELGNPYTTYKARKEFAEKLKNTEVSQLLLQILFFNGRLDILSNKKYYESYKNMLSTVDERQKYLDFFKSYIVPRTDGRFEMLRAYRYLKADQAVAVM